MEEVKPMTVKYIVTSYVEADATEFKSVVQRLTGKDSTVTTAAAALPEEKGSRRRCQAGHHHVVPPAPRRWLRRNDDGFLDVMPSIEEMDEFLRD
uniref:VQ domain-containing protein n=1 Tax=Oryza punctata TaxID=4537 RepID=A0A0E0KZR9_ORYPU